MIGLKFLLKKYFVEIGLVVLLLVHFIFLSNLKFTAWPEMLNWPYLMLNNFLPYRDIAIAHNPLLLFVLTGFYKLAGVSVWELEVFTWMVIILSDIILFYVIEKLVNPKVAVFALAFYIPLQVFYGGNGMWFDLFMVPLILISFYFVRCKKYMLAGVFWALAFLTKQTAVWFLVPILLEVQSSKFKVQSFRKICAGIFIVFLLFLFLLISYNLISDYLFWAVKFGVFTLPGSVGQISFPGLKQSVLYFFPFLPLLYFLFRKKKKEVALTIWTLAGVLSIYPRFETFHFQPALPFLALSFAYFLDRYFSGLSRPTKGIYILYLFILSIFVVRYSLNNYGGSIRFLESQTVESAGFIKTLTSEGESTYFLNVWENMYPMTNTLPATKPLVPHLSWYMELPGIQSDVVDDLKKESPKYIFVGEFKGGELSTYVPRLIYAHITSEYKASNVVNGITVYSRTQENLKR